MDRKDARPGGCRQPGSRAEGSELLEVQRAHDPEDKSGRSHSWLPGIPPLPHQWTAGGGDIGGLGQGEARPREKQEGQSLLPLAAGSVALSKPSEGGSWEEVTETMKIDQEQEPGDSSM